MRASQRIVGVERVVKLGIEPVCRRVTGVAPVREAQLHVARIVGAGEIGQVTGIAVFGQRGVVVVCVALRAAHRCMSASQRESRVIESCRTPSIGGVAHRAICRESGGDVLWTGGSHEI